MYLAVTWPNYGRYLKLLIYLKALMVLIKTKMIAIIRAINIMHFWEFSQILAILATYGTTYVFKADMAVLEEIFVKIFRLIWALLCKRNGKMLQEQALSDFWHLCSNFGTPYWRVYDLISLTVNNSLYYQSPTTPKPKCIHCNFIVCLFVCLFVLLPFQYSYYQPNKGAPLKGIPCRVFL